MRCYRDCGHHRREGIHSFFKINYHPLQVFEMIKPMLWAPGFNDMGGGLYSTFYW